MPVFCFSDNTADKSRKPVNEPNPVPQQSTSNPLKPSSGASRCKNDIVVEDCETTTAVAPTAPELTRTKQVSIILPSKTTPPPRSTAPLVRQAPRYTVFKPNDGQTTSGNVLTSVKAVDTLLLRRPR